MRSSESSEESSSDGGEGGISSSSGGGSEAMDEEGEWFPGGRCGCLLSQAVVSVELFGMCVSSDFRISRAT